MINSKQLKLLCKILMYVIYLLSAVSIIGGISMLMRSELLGGVLLLSGILLPLIATISLYPIFTLANIDENLTVLNKKVDTFLEKQSEHISDASESQSDAVEQYSEGFGEENNDVQENKASYAQAALVSKIVGKPDPDTALESLNKLYVQGYITEPQYNISRAYDSQGILVWHCECHIDEPEKHTEGDFYSKEYGKEVVAYQLLLSLIDSEKEDVWITP